MWYFRQVIDQVGQASVAQQLAALDYGNQDISQWEGGGQNQSPELNGFWIDSSLKISPLEQVQVLTKGFEGRSQYTQEEVDTLRTIMLVQDDGTRQVYGKTGSGFGETGWFVGFQEKAGARTYFAVYLADENRTVSGSQAGGGLCPAKRNGLTCMSRMPKFHLRGHFFLTGSGCDKIPSNFILGHKPLTWR